MTTSRKLDESFKRLGNLKDFFQVAVDATAYPINNIYAHTTQLELKTALNEIPIEKNNEILQYTNKLYDAIIHHKDLPGNQISADDRKDSKKFTDHVIKSAKNLYNELYKVPLSADFDNLKKALFHLIHEWFYTLGVKDINQRKALEKVFGSLDGYEVLPDQKLPGQAKNAFLTYDETVPHARPLIPKEEKKSDLSPLHSLMPGDSILTVTEEEKKKKAEEEKKKKEEEIKAKEEKEKEIQAKIAALEKAKELAKQKENELKLELAKQAEEKNKAIELENKRKAAEEAEKETKKLEDELKKLEEAKTAKTPPQEEKKPVGEPKRDEEIPQKFETKIKAIIEKLQNDTELKTEYKEWKEEEVAGNKNQKNLKSGTLNLTVHSNNTITSNNPGSELLFRAMLISFKIAQPDKLPVIKTDSAENRNIFISICEGLWPDHIVERIKKNVTPPYQKMPPPKFS